MSIRKSSMIVVAAAALLLGSCRTPPSEVRFPEITFGHQAPFTLTASRIDVDSRYQPPMRAPNIEHLVPVPPERALRRWAQDRLRTGGQPGTVRFTITEASVTEYPLAVTGGVRGAFTKDQAAEFTATVEASVEVLDGRGFRLAFATARVNRLKSIREDTTLNDRERALFSLVDDVMKDFDREIERNIRQYLVGYLL